MFQCSFFESVMSIDRGSCLVSVKQLVVVAVAVTVVVTPQNCTTAHGALRAAPAGLLENNREGVPVTSQNVLWLEI